MKQLLFPLVFTEMLLILTLLFKTPLRKLVIMGLDRVKQGRGPVMAKTVAGTLFVVLVSSSYTIMKIQKRMIDSGTVNPTDQVLLANHLLEASLMGFTLFLPVIIDGLHVYIKELQWLRMSLDSVQKQNQGYEEMKYWGKDDFESKAMEGKTLAFGTENKQLLQPVSKTKLKEANPKTDYSALKGEIKKA